MSDSSPRPAGVYWFLVLGLASFSISPILVRLAGDVPGLAVAAWRTMFAVALLLPGAALRIGPEVRRLSGRERLLIGAAGVLLGLHFVTWIESLRHTSVASTSVLVTTSPIFLGLFGYWFLRERLPRRTWAAIGLACSGSVLLAVGDASDADFPNALLGNSLALTAALLVTAYLLIGRVVRQRVSWLGYVFPVYLTCSLTTLAGAWFVGVPLGGYPPLFYGICVLMAVFPQIVGHGSFSYAVRFFPAAFLGLLGLTEPVFASLIAFFLFDEQPTPLALAGMVLVLASIALAVKPEAGVRDPGPGVREGGSSDPAPLPLPDP